MHEAMQALEVSGVLYQLIPELKEGKGVTQNQIYHAFDVCWGITWLPRCQPARAALRWSALLHDVGKPRAKDETGRMIGHDAIGAAMSAEILTRLGADNHTVRLVHDLIARHMFDLNGSAKLNTVRKHFAVWGVSVCRAAHCCGAVTLRVLAGRWWIWIRLANGNKFLTQMRSQGCIDDIRQLRISGAEIMQACQLSPSPMVGRIKQALFEQCAMDPEKTIHAGWFRWRPKCTLSWNGAVSNFGFAIFFPFSLLYFFKKGHTFVMAFLCLSTRGLAVQRAHLSVYIAIDPKIGKINV